MILQFVPNLQVDRELRHELVAPVLVRIALHHCNRVVLLLIGADEVRNCIWVAISICVEVVGSIAVYHFLSHIAFQGNRQGGSQIEG